jgi:hypothetical protein
VKQLEAVGTRLEAVFDVVEDQTSSPTRAIAFGMALAMGVIIGGLVSLFVLLKVLTALF